MVRQVTESFLCDICGSEGERYTVQFPDGNLVLDRCPRHDRKLQSLRNEKGTFIQPEAARNGFKITSADEIQRQRERHKART